MCYFAKALQHIFHLLITTEEIGKRLLHRVKVGQCLVLLHDELLDGVMGKRFLFLVILWWTHIERMQIKSLLGEETVVMGKNTVKRPQSAHKHTQKTSLTFFTIYLNVFVVVWFNKMFYCTIWGFLINQCSMQNTKSWTMRKEKQRRNIRVASRPFSVKYQCAYTISAYKYPFHFPSMSNSVNSPNLHEWLHSHRQSWVKCTCSCTDLQCVLHLTEYV